MKLTDELFKLYNSEEYPLHMPGHKRSDMGLLSNVYHLDITEIEGYDNLYDSQGILKEAMERVGKFYNCPNTFYLVNGSTTGILTAISAVSKIGDYILIASNSHRSVHNIIELRGLHAEYVYTNNILSNDIDGGINPKDVEKKLKETKKNGKSFCAVVVTSPNYDGIISDIKTIADICHSFDIPLIVDEAHGAHLIIDKSSYDACIERDIANKGALYHGADIVIHSTHKTLSAMTQTALLHVQGSLVDINEIKKYWNTFQTSSPSYVLMASVDEAVCELIENGDRLWQDFLVNRRNFDRECQGLKYLHLLSNNDIKNEKNIVAIDKCKITVLTKGTKINGFALQRILLDEYKIQIELASEERIIAIVTYADTVYGFQRFSKALLEIDDKIEKGEYDTYKGFTQASVADGRTKNLYAPCIPKY